jgi:hypothetical protein
MYTTLALLKASDACVPGYGRMISFFGIAPALKDQKIPLHVVALVGGPDDFDWALSNGVLLDEEEYKEFYRRNFVFALRAMLADRGYGSRVSANNTEFKKKPFIWKLILEARAATTFEECEAFLKKLRMQYHAHWLFSDVATHSAWSSPHEFIGYCADKVQLVYNESSFWKWPKVKAVAASSAPETATALSAAPSVDDFDEGMVEDADDEENDRPSARRARPAPRRAVSTNINKYWFPNSKATNTKGLNIAYLFTDDPFAFMGELKFKMPKGVTIKEVGGKPTLVTAVTDTQSMFNIVRSMTNKSHADADQEESD